jgi:hypothetical protein
VFWLDNCLDSDQEKSNYLIDCNIKKQKLVKQKKPFGQVAKGTKYCGLRRLTVHSIQAPVKKIHTVL